MFSVSRHRFKRPDPQVKERESEMVPFHFFLYLSYMKLLNAIKQILLESGRRPILLFADVIEDKRVRLFASYHQWEERYGQFNFDKIADFYLKDKDRNINNLSYVIRVGVPNDMIVTFFDDNYEKIKQHFYELYGPPSNDKFIPEQKIIFVKQFSDNPREEDFDYIEIGLAREIGETYFIFTSAFSKDGKMLRKFKGPESPKVFMESVLESIPIVYLD